LCPQISVAAATFENTRRCRDALFMINPVPALKGRPKFIPAAAAAYVFKPDNLDKKMKH
jgi:hypothetical protein